ncbi:DUF4258 domain-containing protein [Bacillus sp. NP157]|nr:DUF4258 domain-containing protein [Bacillus sp. NP157]
MTRHAEQRMVEREITLKQLLTCLRRGDLAESPRLDEHGNWKLVVEAYTAGDHLASIVALDTRQPQAIVITTFWVL